MNEPSVECGDFLYEEAEGMEPDEVERCQVGLPLLLKPSFTVVPCFSQGLFWVRVALSCQ